MKNSLIIISWMSCLLLTSCAENVGTANMKKKEIVDQYPVTAKDSTVVEDYHGKQIADPYRWLEDDHSDETKSWVSDQNEVTFSYLDKIPYRNKVKDRLTEIWNYERYSSPFKRGDKYYYFKNDGLQNQSVLYAIEGLTGDGKVVLDPNTFSEDGTTSLGGFSFNEEGTLLAYMISEGGSDWRTAQILDLKTMNTLDDKIEWIKFSGLSWKDDGFFYSRYPVADEEDELSAKNENHSVYYHKIGTTQDEDQLIFSQPEHPQRNSYAQTTEDERFLIIASSESTSGNSLSVKDLSKSNSSILPIITSFTDDYSIVDNDGENLIKSRRICVGRSYP